MKYLKITMLMTILLVFGTANATELTPAEILSAIDGESEIMNVESEIMNVERVNFDISIDDVNDATGNFWKPTNAGLLDDTYY
jgi:predicted phosphatase